MVISAKFFDPKYELLKPVELSFEYHNHQNLQESGSLSFVVLLLSKELYNIFPFEKELIEIFWNHPFKNEVVKYHIEVKARKEIIFDYPLAQNHFDDKWD